MKRGATESNGVGVGTKEKEKVESGNSRRQIVEKKLPDKKIYRFVDGTDVQTISVEKKKTMSEEGEKERFKWRKKREGREGGWG